MRQLLVAMILVVFVSETLEAQEPPVISRWKEAAQPTAYGRDNGLQPDALGDPFQISWGIFNEGSLIFDNQPPSNLRARMDEIYSGGEAEWLPIFSSTFDRWESISGLTFNYEANDDGESFFFTTGVTGARADIRIGGRPMDGDNNVLARAWSPNRDIVIDTSDGFYNNTAAESLRLRNVLAHEVGHVLGMPHVLNSSPDFLMEPQFNASYDGAQLHDIMMVQWGYGDALEKSNGGAGNDDFGTATSLGNLSAVGSVEIGEDARIDSSTSTFEVFPTEIDFFTIDDETDVDTFGFALGEKSSLAISLEALGFTYNTGPNGGTPTAFNSRARSDLSFEVFDASGTSLLLVDDSGLQGIESTMFGSLNSGDYFLKIYGVDNPDDTPIDAQFYSLILSATAVPEPSALIFLLGGLSAVTMRRRRVAVL